MAATKQDIQRWFDWKKEEGFKYMLVMCDTFDWEDYPVGINTLEEYNKWKNRGNMQKFMECYDLKADIEPQLSVHRVDNVPKE